MIPVAVGAAVPAATELLSPRPAWRRPRALMARAGRLVTTACMLAALTGLCFVGVGPRVFGYRTITMLTGSMSPTIRPGDVVVDTPEPAADLTVGQIVTYAIPVYDRHVESHRVVSVKHLPGGGVRFTTKGDANDGPDPWTAQVGDTKVWVVRSVVPYMGRAIEELRQPAVSATLHWGAPAAVVVLALIAIWKRKPTETHSEESDGQP